jgi:hypothetical protein
VFRRVALPLVAVGAGALAMIGLLAAPASAHTISGPRPNNYRSRVVAIAPPAPGVTARVVDLGSKIELTNRSSTEVLVLGYVGEPYLRIGPEGVFENLHSQATYINRSRQGGSVPVDVDTSPSAPPEWKKIGSGNAARWHDHRIHWMGAQLPPAVAAAPGSFQHLSQQNIKFVHNGVTSRIAVSLDWVPGPSGLPWLPAIIVLFVLGFVAAFLPKWWRLLAVLLALLVISDIAHAVAYEIPRPGANSTKVFQFLGGAFVSIAVWVAAILTIVGLVRRRIEALYGVVFVGLLVALIGGATDISALWKSQLPDAGPAWLTRLEVVLALGLGAGLVVGAVIRMLRTRSNEEVDGDGRWLSLLVTGLSDAELARIVPELDADEVLAVALRELSVRAAPVADAFAGGALAFDVTDEADPVTWSVVLAGDDTARSLRATRGRAEPTAAEIRAPFAVMLRLLAGSVSIDDAIARALLTVDGDAALVATVAPYLPEGAPVTPAAEDPASAS